MAKVGKRGRKTQPRARRRPAAPRPSTGERFELAMRAINEGVYDWDIANGTIYYSEGVYSVLHMPRSVKTPMDWRKRIHPEDLAAYDAAIRAHFLKKTKRFECDYRYRARDRSWRWARQHGIAIRDPRGRAVRMIGSTGDITEHKRVEQALTESQERLTLATQAATEGIYEWNLETGMLFLSDRSKAFFAVAGDKLTPATWNKRVHGEDYQGYRDAIVAFFKGRTPNFEHEYRIRSAAGGWSWVVDRAVAVRDAQGQVVRLVGALTDITQRKLAEIELRRARDEATEALERQTATAEVLKVIASSPADVQPVFNAILRSAVNLCGAEIAAVFPYDGKLVHLGATYNWSEEALKYFSSVYPAPPSPALMSGRTILARSMVKLADAAADGYYDPNSATTGHWRRMLGVPMMREGQLLGALVVCWREPGETPQRQVDLLQTFADQAVIAIENVRLFKEIEARNRDLGEALEQQTATAEVLRAISSSPNDIRPILDALVHAAARFCGAPDVAILQLDGDVLRGSAAGGPFGEAMSRQEGGVQAIEIPVTRGSVSGRAVVERRVVHVHDLAAEPEDEFPVGRDLQRRLGHRAMVSAPLLREGAPLGVIALFRTEAKPFSDKQLGLLQVFADQAVIAIENVRLFNETREALERQTATAEILKVIASSPSDVQPVFDAIVQSAARLFGRKTALRVVEAGALRRKAQSYETGGEFHSAEVLPITRDNLVGKVVLDGRAAQSADIRADGTPYARAHADELSFRSIAAAPLIRDGVAIGSIAMSSPEPGALSEKQMELLATFADQAVIAIENVRLFNETREALERQTATAEILNVIASSPADVQPVFDAIAKSAYRLIGGFSTAVARVFDGVLHLVAFSSTDEAGNEALQHAFPMPVSRSKAARTGEPVAISDTETLPDSASAIRELARTRGFRSILIVPMLRESVATGTISVTRREPGEFTNHQIDLLKTFADQAVIAIENVRLFNETKEALERQTATAEILKVISSSPTDVQPVFNAIARNANILCNGLFANVFRFDGELLHISASAQNAPQALDILQSTYPARPSAAQVSGRVVLSNTTVRIEDALADPDYDHRFADSGGWRRILGVPMLRDGNPIGAIVVGWSEPGPIQQRHEDLLKTFADQAVIAIENVRLFNETREALERQTATAEILKVISESPTNVQPVFDAIAHSAHRLFGRRTGLTILRDGALHIASGAGFTAEESERIVALYPMPVDQVTSKGFRAMREGKVLETTDVEVPGTPHSVHAVARAARFRAIVSVPLLRGDAVVGQLSLTSVQVEPRLDEKQIGLLKTFADQAVIAIENVRLFNETKEALERQTATAEILRVISSTPSDTQPVFDAIVENTQRLINGKSTVLLLRRDSQAVVAGYSGPNLRDLPDQVRNVPLDRSKNFPSRAILDGEVVHVPDWEGDDVPEFEKLVGRAYGIRSGLMVPLLRNGEGIGAIVVFRVEAGPFREKEIALLQSFADQAVIAIENVRLFNETREALERQTATAEILRVISSSPTDTQPVFDAIVQSGLKLFSGAGVGISIADGGELRVVATAGNLGASGVGIHLPISRESASGMAIVERRVVNIKDTEAPDAPPHARDNGRKLHVRSMTLAPMFREGEPIGAIGVILRAPGGLDDKQIKLLQTFADQAVIAIENVRLFKELQSRTEALTKSVGQLTALGEVGQAISSTLDLETVLKTIVSRAVQLTGLDGGSIYEYDEHTEEFHLRATENVDEDYLAVLRRTPIRKGEGAVGGTALTGEPTQIPDIQDQSYQTRLRDALIRAGYRALLVVPLRREEHVIGALSVTRKTPGPFAPEIVELLKTFATQSAMAIQNARLFREIAEKGRQLELASQHKSNFLASMSHELRTPLNAILGFNEMILGQVYGEVPADMQEPLADIQTSGKHLLRLINNVLDLAKIEAGRMELSLQDYSVHDTVESVRATLRPLAADKGLEFLATLPEDLPLAYGDSGRIAQCLMNLAGNSLKFTKAGKVEISVETKGELLVYKVSDTGIGIPPDKIGSLFTEFKQTDATIASEYGGTGLGLSISRKFVEMHGGRIWVESEPGRGSAFIFEVPLRATTT